MRFILFLSLFMPFTAYCEYTTINFNNIFQNTRLGVFIDQHYNKLNGIYTALISLHDKEQLELFNVNIGYVERDLDGKNSPLIALGFRLDSIVKKLSKSSWSQSHANFSELPSIEFGPYVSSLINKDSNGDIDLDTIYGVGFALRF